jgi:hypothetical protein
MMLIGGAGLALIGQTMLMVEGRSQAPSGRHARGFMGFLARTRYAAVMGGFLVGLSAFQAEFDFGVPQFRLLFQPVLIAAAAGIALVAARVYGGRGAALAAVAYFIVIRGIVGLLVGPVLGETTPHMPLYLVEGAAIEVLALAVTPTRAYRFGALSGLLIGTVGFAAEYGWSHIWMPHPWPAALLGEALVAVLVTAVAAGVLGAFIGSALGANRAGALVTLPRVAPAALALAAIVAVFAYGLDTKPVEGVRASVTLRDVSPAPDRTVEATVRIDPPSAARDAGWLTAMAWQGGGLEINRLRQVAPGVWRTTAPLPVRGDWKTLVRLHRGRSIVAMPIYLPKDDAIPAPEVPASARFDRTFVLEQNILQREKKSDVPASLQTVAYGAVGSIVLALFGLLGWSLTRLGTTSAPDAGAPRRRRGAPRGVVAEGSPS